MSLAPEEAERVEVETAAEIAKDHYAEDRDVGRDLRMFVLGVLLPIATIALLALQFGPFGATARQQAVLLALAIGASIIALRASNKKETSSMRNAAKCGVLTHKARFGDAIRFDRLVENVKLQTRRDADQAGLAVASYLEREERAYLRATRVPESPELALPRRFRWGERMVRAWRSILRAAGRLDTAELRKHTVPDESTTLTIVGFGLAASLVVLVSVGFAWFTRSIMLVAIAESGSTTPEQGAAMMAAIVFGFSLAVFSGSFFRYSLGEFAMEKVDPSIPEDKVAQDEVVIIKWMRVIRTIAVLGTVAYAIKVAPHVPLELFAWCAFAFAVCSWFLADSRERLGRRVLLLRLHRTAREGERIRLHDLTREIARVTRLRSEDVRAIAIGSLRDKHGSFDLVVDHDLRRLDAARTDAVSMPDGTASSSRTHSA